MNGIIFCVCLTLAIAVLQIVLKWCRKERKKIQVKKESQQNRSRWWIWSRYAAKELWMCYLLLHQKARWKPDMKVNFTWARKLSSILERCDPLYTLTHQASQNGMLTKNDLLKSGNLMTWWKLEQERPVYEQPPCLFIEHTDKFIFDDDDMDSDTVTESDMSLKSKSFLHKVNDRVRKMSEPIFKRCNDKTADKHSVICGECLCLQHWKHLYSWKRITQTICIPSKIQGTNSRWNRCATYLKINFRTVSYTRFME